jgi:hypothetical protein
MQWDKIFTLNVSQKEHRSCETRNFVMVSVAASYFHGIIFCKYLYSSLIPYAMTISGRSVSTALAAMFMRSSALRSFGFSKVYFAENLHCCQLRCSYSQVWSGSTCGSLGRLCERLSRCWEARYLVVQRP